MQLGDAQRRFIEARATRRHIGLWVLPVGLAGVMAAWILFFVYFPLAVNPWKVLGHIEAHDFEPGTMTMYAITCTVLVNVLFMLVCAILVASIAWASHERRYLRLLQAALKPAPSGPVPPRVESPDRPRQ
jgi:hypothetical protein